jgi:dTDP-4-dehydrorhamnose reductase
LATIVKILILGANGQLGQAMTTRLGTRHEVVARTRSELDIARGADVAAALRALRPQVVINCAAYTNVDGAQDEPLSALAANAWGPLSLARAAREIDATVVHFSTDFVFDGEASQPYRESDAPRPQGTYAVSKLLGEWFTAELPRAYVLRVESLFGGANARSSVDLLLKAIRDGKEARAFSDRVVSPSYVDDVVEATSALLEREGPPGLYHCVNTGLTTWFELAQELARLACRPDALITPVPMNNAGLKTPRPRFAALSNAKLAGIGIPMPTWQDALRRYVGSQ